MTRVAGFVVVAPSGVVEGSFTTSRDRAVTTAEAFVVINGYHATEVRISEAAIVVPRDATSWPLSKKRIAALNMRVYRRPTGWRRRPTESAEKSPRAAARTTARRA